MWSVGDDNQGSHQTQDLSKGFGLALLSKALGFEKIKDRFADYTSKMKKTELIGKFELRRKL